MKTIKELSDTMYEYEDVSVGTAINQAISDLLGDDDEFVKDGELNYLVLGKIHTRIAQLASGSGSEFLLLAMISQNDNPTEAALQYIENLQRNISQ